MDSSNPSDQADNYDFLANDEDLWLWDGELAELAELDPSQFFPFDTDLSQPSMQLPDLGSQHYSTSLSLNPDLLAVSSDLILDDYIQPTSAISPATTIQPIPAVLPGNNAPSEQSNSGKENVATHRADQRTAPSTLRSSENGKKHRLEDSIHVFSLNSQKEVTPRRGSPFLHLEKQRSRGLEALVPAFNARNGKEE
jgi:hypothetical protein